MSFRTTRGILSLLPAAVLVGAVGCGEAPTAHDDEVEIHELIISDAGAPVVMVDHGVVTGSISVDAGDETPDYDFIFIDHDGDTITAGFETAAVVQNTGLAIFHATADFEAHLEGLSPGATTVVVSLVHSADGDSHYDSPAIDLAVN